MKCLTVALIGLTMMTPIAFADDDRPHGLLCQLFAEPELTLISQCKPRFGWIFPSGSDGDFQTAYQILVAASAEVLKDDRGDLWDSGKMSSGQSLHVAYAGSPLPSHAACYWKVRTWDRHDAASAYSAPHCFRTVALRSEHVTDRYPLIKRRVSAKRFLEKRPGHYFIDFGKAAFGTIEITCAQPCDGDSFIVHLGEKLRDSTTVDRHPPGTVRYRRIKTAVRADSHTVVVTIPPDERNTGDRAIKMPPAIGEVMPFRYCEIEKCPAELHPEAVTQIAVNYPFDDDAAFFHCSDPVLNDVWELCKYSIKATSFCGVYVDGDRERIPYEADAYINQLGHYCVDREYTLARYSHEYLIKNATWPTEWILHSLLMAWADYLYTGDTASLSHNYADLQAKTLLALARADGLISTRTGLVTHDVLEAIHLNDTLRDIVDWPPGSFMFGGTGERDNYHMGAINTVVNAFHYRALVLMNRIAVALDKTEDAAFYAACAERVKKSINEKLYDAERGIYIDCQDSTHASLHANMFSLAFGLVPPERQDTVVEFIKSRGMACSVYGAHYLLEALYDAGEAQYALELMTARHDRSWPHMIYNVGATITLEAWDQKYKKNLDWNHAWGAAPANIIPRCLIGVQPTAPGFATLRVKPQIADLAFARAKVPTIRGAVHVLAQQDAQIYRLEVTVPGNCTATVYVPVFTESQNINVNGKEVRATKEGKFLYVKNVGAGVHTIVVEK
ncbi:family 78 glycoside hydrolase catalytic domain [candidate division KSB1 bacterium]|nr:family 78 glycoside hydrolase catalytic domain [candidate division KSB1 bacterium]